MRLQNSSGVIRCLPLALHGPGLRGQCWGVQFKEPSALTRTLGSVRGEVTDHYGTSYSGTQLETVDTDKAFPTNAQWLLLLGGSDPVHKGRDLRPRGLLPRCPFRGPYPQLLKRMH